MSIKIDSFDHQIMQKEMHKEQVYNVIYRSMINHDRYEVSNIHDSVIMLNLDISKKFGQTLSYKEWLEGKKSPIYTSILEAVLIYIKNKCEYYTIHVAEATIDRILSFYLIPQNHNGLDIGSIYRNFHSGNLNYLVEQKILHLEKYNYNSYYKFNSDIEKIIIRLYKIEKLLY